jgi:hypothetical protein
MHMAVGTVVETPPCQVKVRSSSYTLFLHSSCEELLYTANCVLLALCSASVHVVESASVVMNSIITSTSNVVA